MAKAFPMRRIPVAKLKEYYTLSGCNPDDLRLVTHAYTNDKHEMFAKIPLAEDAFKGMVYSTSETA